MSRKRPKESVTINRNILLLLLQPGNEVEPSVGKSEVKTEAYAMVSLLFE